MTRSSAKLPFDTATLDRGGSIARSFHDTPGGLWGNAAEPGVAPDNRLPRQGSVACSPVNAKVVILIQHGRQR